MSDSKQRIAIVGGGIIALEIARQISKYYSNVTIIRPATDEQIGSHAALGVSSVKGANWPREPLFELKINATTRYSTWLKQLETESGQKIEQLNSASEVISKQADFSFKVERAFHREFLGLHRVNYKGNVKFSEIEYPIDMAANPTEIMTCLSNIIANNLKVIESKVKELDFLSDSTWSILLVNQKKIFFDKVILAAGTGLSELVSQKSNSSWGLKPVYGHSITWKNIKADPRFILDGTMAMILFKKTGFFGSTSFNDAKANQAVLKKSLEEKLQTLCMRTNIKCEEEFGDLQFRFGVRLRAKDRLPLIGFVEPEHNGGSLLVCGAFFKNGFHLANEAGKIILKNLLGNQPSELEKHFSPQRFQNN